MNPTHSEWTVEYSVGKSPALKETVWAPLPHLKWTVEHSVGNQWALRETVWATTGAPRTVDSGALPLCVLWPVEVGGRVLLQHLVGARLRRLRRRSRRSCRRHGGGVCYARHLARLLKRATCVRGAISPASWRACAAERRPCLASSCHQSVSPFLFFLPPSAFETLISPLILNATRIMGMHGVYTYRVEAYMKYGNAKIARLERLLCDAGGEW